MRQMSVRLYVHTSVKRVDYGKMKGGCTNIFIPHDKTFILFFRHEEWLGTNLLCEILRLTDLILAKKPIFYRYSLVAPQP